MKLSSLKDDAFDQALQRAARRERLAIADVVEHLAEADRREWHIRKGFPGLTNYCVARLKYSQEAAGKRVTAARLVRKYPLALQMLREGEVHLSGLLVLSPVLQADNYEERLKAAAGKTREQIELLVVGWKPKPLVETRVFEVNAPALELPRAPRPRPLDPQHYKLQLCIDLETYEDLRWLQEHMRHSIPDGDAAKVIAKAIKDLRKEVEKRRYGKTDKPKTVLPKPDSRAPGRATRREVSERDGCQCTYVADDGHRCESTAWLQFDHVEEWATGGPTETDNLRMLCHAHHRARSRHPPRGGFSSAIADTTGA